MSAQSFEASVIGQTIVLNGERILPDIDPPLLQEALVIGRTAVLAGIEAYYEQMRARNPGAKIAYPTMFVTPLATPDTLSQRKKVLTARGWANGSAIHRNPGEIRKPYHPLWNAIQEADFNPEVRSSIADPHIRNSLSLPNVGGVWLMLRKPEGG